MYINTVTVLLWLYIARKTKKNVYKIVAITKEQPIIYDDYIKIYAPINIDLYNYGSRTSFSI